MMTKHSDCDEADIDNPLMEKPSRPKPIRATSGSSLPASAPSSGGGGISSSGRRAQMMRSMRNLNRPAAAGAGASSADDQQPPRRSSTGDARKAFGGALIGQDRQRGKNIDNNGSNSMPNLYQENNVTGRIRANTGTSNSSKRDIRPASTGIRSNETSARSLQSSASTPSRRDIIVQELHRSESGRHVADSPSNNTGATDQHSMFEEATRRRAERAAARRRSQEGPAARMIDNDLQAQLAQANGGGGGTESRRKSMGSRISSMSSASDLSSPLAGGGSRRRSGDHIRRSMDLSHVAPASSGSGRKGSMSHNFRPQCSTRSLNTSASAMSAVSNASSTLISEQPVVEEEFSRLRLQMSSQQQSQSQTPPSASAAAVSSSTMDDDERLARELQEHYDRESQATHEGGHGLDMTELYDGTRLMVVNRNSIGHGSVGGGVSGAADSGGDRRVLCAGCNGRFRVSSGCELLMCPKCDTLTPV